MVYSVVKIPLHTYPVCTRKKHTPCVSQACALCRGCGRVAGALQLVVFAHIICVSMLLRQQRAPGSPARVRRCMSIGLGVVYVCVLCVLLLYVVCVARCVCCAAARGSLCLSVCCVPVHMHASFVGGALWGVCERLVACLWRNPAIPFIRYAQIKRGVYFGRKNL